MAPTTRRETFRSGYRYVFEYTCSSFSYEDESLADFDQDYSETFETLFREPETASSGVEEMEMENELQEGIKRFIEWSAAWIEARLAAEERLRNRSEHEILSDAVRDRLREAKCHKARLGHAKVARVCVEERYVEQVDQDGIYVQCPRARQQAEWAAEQAFVSRRREVAEAWEEAEYQAERKENERRRKAEGWYDVDPRRRRGGYVPESDGTEYAEFTFFQGAWGCFNGDGHRKPPRNQQPPPKPQYPRKKKHRFWKDKMHCHPEPDWAREFPEFERKYRQGRAKAPESEWPEDQEFPEDEFPPEEDSNWEDDYEEEERRRSRYEPRPLLLAPEQDNLYTLLGVNFGSTQQEILKAARRKRVEVHPDRFSSRNLSPEEEVRINERAKMVGHAADILCDGNARARYDGDFEHAERMARRDRY